MDNYNRVVDALTGLADHPTFLSLTGIYGNELLQNAILSLERLTELFSIQQVHGYHLLSTSGRGFIRRKNNAF